MNTYIEYIVAFGHFNTEMLLISDSNKDRNIVRYSFAHIFKLHQHFKKEMYCLTIPKMTWPTIGPLRVGAMS